jgi:hypothetical protein
MADLGCTVSEVSQEHLQNLMSQGYMTVVELTSCCVHEDPASPFLVGGYVVACAMFYKQIFGVLHMAAFVTLCEAYMGIEP